MVKKLLVFLCQDLENMTNNLNENLYNESRGGKNGTDYQSKSCKKIKYQFVFYITLISFLMSIVDVYSTSLLFTLPFFFMCVLCVGILLY